MQNDDADVGGFNGTDAGISRDSLEKLNDDALRKVIMYAQNILAAREAAARKEAERKIKEIAGAYGIKVTIAPGPKKKQGRPRKSEGNQAKTA